ncbi:response regulator transcription factor [Streptomyces sp. NBC_01803]|uniref:response regulator transcription factor n=1 Tax=Streptomyces sp. NBC_01803 TaxID=2975946 RepID=UPI002DDA358A|nr:response regulator transcription factor [Streptomyces sp. NBC_01803]WSA42954.1 response regulator transcription factor [Streptomyces sp. NBC_01803]
MDDHPLVLSGLRSLLETASRFEVVASFIDACSAVEHIRRVRPDLVICDVRLSNNELGPDVCRRILADSPETRVVMFSAFMDARILRACLDEGASAVLLKTSGELDLMDTLTRVLDGERVIDPSVAEAVLSVQVLSVDGALLSELRPSEHKVLRLLSAGLSTREIECELGLANSTVRGYTQSLMEKLDAHSRVELVVKARELRLV